MQRRIVSIVFLFALMASPLFAQRINYVSLMNRANAPQIFVDEMVYPTEEGKAKLSVIFRFDNDFLPFKKLTPTDQVKAPTESEFYTIVKLNMEIFEGKVGKRTSNISIAARDMWIDTLYTKTFEETESKNKYASGSLTNTLNPGQYNYLLQLALMKSGNERNSNPSDLTIPDWEKKKTGEVFLAKSISETGGNKKVELLNIADNVFFGKDFYALIRIPNYSASSPYSVNITEAKIDRRDTSKTGNTIYSAPIESSAFVENAVPVLTKGEDPSFVLTPSSQEFTYAIVKIPNATFENSMYMLEVVSGDSKTPVARRLFRSYWQGMPASLYNLDIAIDHMKFIISEDQVRKIKSGSQAEKEKKFREFWDQRDPTPNTVYNELMAEYYRRIDYAFKTFGNRGNLAGHESDQGEVYIKFGPPESKERQFPTNGNVREIWNYKNRTFVFEASTGFGDFILLGADTDKS